MKSQNLSRRAFCKLLSLGAIASAGGVIPFMSAARKTLASTNANQKFLIVYFSHSGNTKKIAQFIQEILNCDSFEVKPAKAYPEDYDTLVNLAREEKNTGFRPELTGSFPNIGEYETVFVGYPSWWGTMPMPLFTFFEQVNCDGKTIVPFTTHEGSRFGQSIRDLQALCPNSAFLDGFETRGSRSTNAKQNVEAWLKTIINIR